MYAAPGHLRGLRGIGAPMNLLVPNAGDRAGEAGATSRTSVTVDGAPVSVEATSTLAPADAGSVRVVTGNVSVRVPLLGGRIEKEAVAHLGRVVEREQALATQGLEEHRGAHATLCAEPRPPGAVFRAGGVFSRHNRGHE